MSPIRERWIARDYSDREIMAEEVSRNKNLRRNKMAAFTRKKTHLQTLLDNGTGIDKLKEVFEELKASYSILEQAHDAYAGLVEEAVLDEEGDYLGNPSESLNSMDLKVTERIAANIESEKSEDKRKELERLKLQLKNSIESFGTPSKLLGQWKTEKSVSQDDMRKELQKIEGWYEGLHREKLELLNADSSEDFAELVVLFNTLVVEEMDRCKTIGLEYLKDMPSEVTTDAGPSGSGSPRVGYSSTKRETVMLPHFSGEEKTAYLKYPVWKKQWDEHITEYEVKYRSTMLMNHLDDKAQLQIVGLETDYEAAITQLDRYYSDSKKVIRACLDDIRSQPQISQYDYKGLVNYKKCLVNNHARLKACNLEHEMSNTAAMGVLIRKVPYQRGSRVAKVSNGTRSGSSG